VKKIYVGNLSWDATDADLNELFSQFGSVQSTAVISDRDTGRSRGFAFVEMDDADANTAIAELDGHELQGRALRVNEAQARERRDDR
jgi:RNA recognition motif-containing protein